mgnify:CR=1 FL=1
MIGRKEGALEGMGDPKEFFRSEILAKKNFLGSMKDAEIFWDAKKQQGFF